MEDDETRALSDYRCAARKIAKLFKKNGKHRQAEEVLGQMETTSTSFRAIREAEKEG